LSLGGNKIDAVSVQYIANALIQNKVRLIMYLIIPYLFSTSIQTLTELNLKDNQIGNTGAQHLANALKHNAVCLVSYQSIAFISIYHFISDTHNIKS